MAVSKTAQDELERIKKNISGFYLYFNDNYKRFHQYRDMVYRTSISDAQRNLLMLENKPDLEFNILEAYINRLLGEFVINEPSYEVGPAEPDDDGPTPSGLIDTVEGHLRHIDYEADKDSMNYECMKDLLTGGFTVAKAYTDYASPMSMNQVICNSRAFDPTLCGFDPMARTSHKGDGNFCFELFPMTEEDFDREYPDVDTAKISYMSSLEEFRWGYKNDKGDKTILVADYFEKKRKRVQIVQLANGKVIQKKKYDEFAMYWNQSGYFEQVPVIVGKPRWTQIETICRYKLVGTEVLSYEETDYEYLPLVFGAGNSIELRQGQSGVSYEMCRPYIYHARGVQDLKNYAGQCLANYLSSMVQHKFIIKKEAIPQEEDFIEALTNPSRASTLVVQAFTENDPTLAIPEPIREVVNVPAPPEVMAAFQVTDPTTQAILGSFSSNLAKDNTQLSGKAVIETISNDNATAMPYINGFLQMKNQLALINLSLMPKYLKGKRQLPVIDKKGEKGYQKINQPGGVDMDYEPHALNVTVEAGVNFNVEKNRAMQQMISLMQASQEFNQFMNSPEGLPILIDNLTVRSADQLKEAIPKYFQQQAQQAQQQQQQAAQMAQNDPSMIVAQAQAHGIALKAQIDQQKAQLDQQKSQMDAMQMSFDQQQQQIDNQINMAKLSIDNKKADAAVLTAQSKATQSQIDASIKLEEGNQSAEIHKIDLAGKLAEVQSRDSEEMHNRVMDMHDARLQEHEAALKEDAQMHEQKMDLHEAALKEHAAGLAHHGSLLKETELAHKITKSNEPKESSEPKESENE